jgi:uncharacterized protein (TIGR02246 family)
VVEAVIRARIEEWAEALRSKNIDSVMSFYAPDVVSFDVVPPLRYSGGDRKRRAWEAAFATFAGPLTYDLHEVTVTTDGELALVHSLNHVTGRLSNGHVSDLWLRWTACFRQIDGMWLVVHDHASVPADLEHGHAMVHLTP